MIWLQLIFFLLNLAIGACSGCMNDGVCGKLNQGEKCFCPKCFTDETCQTRITGCCENGGIYVSGNCQCALGFTGLTCSYGSSFFLFFLNYFLIFLLII